MRIWALSETSQHRLVWSYYLPVSRAKFAVLLFEWFLLTQILRIGRMNHHPFLNFQLETGQSPKFFASLPLSRRSAFPLLPVSHSVTSWKIFSSPQVTVTNGQPSSVMTTIPIVAANPTSAVGGGLRFDSIFSFHKSFPLNRAVCRSAYSEDLPSFRARNGEFVVHGGH